MDKFGSGGAAEAAAAAAGRGWGRPTRARSSRASACSISLCGGAARPICHCSNLSTWSVLQGESRGTQVANGQHLEPEREEFDEGVVLALRVGHDPKRSRPPCFVRLGSVSAIGTGQRAPYYQPTPPVTNHHHSPPSTQHPASTTDMHHQQPTSDCAGATAGCRAHR